jgi:hypothetical protein
MNIARSGGELTAPAAEGPEDGAAAAGVSSDGLGMKIGLVDGEARTLPAGPPL